VLSQHLADSMARVATLTATIRDVGQKIRAPAIALAETMHDIQTAVDSIGDGAIDPEASSSPEAVVSQAKDVASAVAKVVSSTKQEGDQLLASLDAGRSATTGLLSVAKAAAAEAENAEHKAGLLDAARAVAVSDRWRRCS
jgi:hypothetical protein